MDELLESPMSLIRLAKTSFGGVGMGSAQGVVANPINESEQQTMTTTKLNKSTTLSAAVGAALMAISAVPSASAADGVFTAVALDSGYQLAAGHEADEGKCGEGKCGGSKASEEGKCGEGKCGGDRDSHEANEKAAQEGKCGEGKCGGTA
jgi:uncharacterized low-complexity protein